MTPCFSALRRYILGLRGRLFLQYIVVHREEYLRDLNGVHVHVDVEYSDGPKEELILASE